MWGCSADFSIVAGAVAPKNAVDLHHRQMQLLAHFADDSHGFVGGCLFLLGFPHTVGAKKTADVNVGLDPVDTYIAQIFPGKGRADAV